MKLGVLRLVKVDVDYLLLDIRKALMVGSFVYRKT